MENSNQYDELLVRYLANDVTIEEKTFAENWIHSSEQNRTYFEDMKKAWQLTGVWDTFRKVNVDDRWNHFTQTVVAQNLNDSLANRGTANAEAGEWPDTVTLEQHRPAGITRWLSRAAIAASLVLAVGLVWQIFFRDKQPAVVVENTVKKADSVTALVRHETNTTGKEKRIELPDGSLIVLADKSEVTYQEPFAAKRHIALTGKAWFKVAKDTTHPFMVSSGIVTTTALGTAFSVTAFDRTDSVTIRLYEGKVVVKAASTTINKLKKPVYLLPGQEFVYDGENGKVRPFKLKQAAATEQRISEELERDNPRIPFDEDGNWYMFNNQSLERVLHQLSALHNVKIVYNKKDIQNIDFTGKYNKSDSLETILKRIGILNNLKITKTDTAYIISK